MQKKALYGLVGFPLGHSLSPAMHNVAFKALGIDAEYVIFETPTGELESFMNSIGDKDIKGFNVTVPYKQRLLSKIELDNESFGVRQIGAVNTVVNRDGILVGFNTDFLGFSEHLRELKVDPKDKRVALLGAGGGARAVAYALARNNAIEIAIFDIDAEKTNSLIEMINENKSSSILSAKAVSSIDELNLKDKDILINATPIGLKDDDPL